MTVDINLLKSWVADIEAGKVRYWESDQNGVYCDYTDRQRKQLLIQIDRLEQRNVYH